MRFLLLALLLSSCTTPKQSSSISSAGLSLPPARFLALYDGLQHEIGRLDWSTGKLVFTGDADKSAYVFINDLIKQYGGCK